MKYEINHDQLKEMLILQKECSDALDQLSEIGIQLEGMKLRIPQYFALLNLVFDILGMPMDGFSKFEKENPTLDNPTLCMRYSKIQNKKPYTFCRDNFIEGCLELLSKNKINECLKFMIDAVPEKQNSQK